MEFEVLLLINFFIGFFIFILGYFIKKYKLSFLISGYNTENKIEKEKYNEKNLVNYVGYLLMISSFILFFGIIFSLIFIEYIVEINNLVWIFYTVFIIFGVLYSNFTNFIKK